MKANLGAFPRHTAFTRFIRDSRAVCLQARMPPGARSITSRARGHRFVGGFATTACFGRCTGGLRRAASGGRAYIHLYGRYFTGRLHSVRELCRRACTTRAATVRLHLSRECDGAPTSLADVVPGFSSRNLRSMSSTYARLSIAAESRSRARDGTGAAIGPFARSKGEEQEPNEKSIRTLTLGALGAVSLAAACSVESVEAPVEETGTCPKPSSAPTTKPFTR